MESGFKLISIGQVVKDKPLDDVYIEVYLTESMPTISGYLNTYEDVRHHIVNSKGKHVSSFTQRRKTIRARWINLYNSNRMTPPDVVTNEFVHIYQISGNDEYFWASISTNLRKKEKVVYQYSNKTKSLTEESVENESYYFIVDTVDKQVGLHTSDNDGEKSAYDLVIDTGEGILTIKDKQGNYINIASTNNDGILSIKVNDTVQISTKNIVEDGSDTHTINTNKQVMNNNTLVINVAEKCVINAPKFAIYGNGVEFVDLMSRTIQASMDEKHIGNLGVLTEISGSSRAEFTTLKNDVDKFLIGKDSDIGKKYIEP